MSSAHALLRFVLSGKLQQIAIVTQAQAEGLHWDDLPFDFQLEKATVDATATPEARKKSWHMIYFMY